jgi:hypothetical protein
MLRNRFPEQRALKDPTVARPCTGRHLPKEMRTSRFVIVLRYADDLMAGFEHREEAGNEPARFRALKVRKQKEGKHLRHEFRDSPSFLTMCRGREALLMTTNSEVSEGESAPRYRRPQLGRGTEKTGETSQRKTNLQLASGTFSCKIAPFTPAGERTKKAPPRGGRTGSNGQQHPMVIDCEGSPETAFSLHHSG